MNRQSQGQQQISYQKQIRLKQIQTQIQKQVLQMIPIDLGHWNILILVVLALISFKAYHPSINQTESQSEDSNVDVPEKNVETEIQDPDKVQKDDQPQERKLGLIAQKVEDQQKVQPPTIQDKVNTAMIDQTVNFNQNNLGQRAEIKIQNLENQKLEDQESTLFNIQPLTDRSINSMVDEYSISQFSSSNKLSFESSDSQYSQSQEKVQKRKKIKKRNKVLKRTQQVKDIQTPIEIKEV